MLQISNILYITLYLKGHQRMVCSVAWAEDFGCASNLFSCGFDRLVLGWSVHLLKDI